MLAYYSVYAAKAPCPVCLAVFQPTATAPSPEAFGKRYAAPAYFAGQHRKQG